MRIGTSATVMIAAGWLGLTLAACGSEPAGAATATAEAARAPVAKVVFIGQQESCDCTRARIDGTWAALQEVIEGGVTVPVERIRMDTQHDQAAPYIAMQALMVAPGLYLLDADGQLIEMLQGELTAEQIERALK
jgi:hypothetical protein